MMTNAVEHFADELDRLVRRFRFEYAISYAEAIGCLTMRTHTLLAEAERLSDDDGEEDAA